jgi:hypothetical protein
MPNYAPISYVAIMSQNSRIVESASVLQPHLRCLSPVPAGLPGAAGSRQPGELVMLRRVVPPAGLAQWRPGGHGLLIPLGG